MKQNIDAAHYKSVQNHKQKMILLFLYNNILTFFIFEKKKTNTKVQQHVTEYMSIFVN